MEKLSGGGDTPEVSGVNKGLPKPRSHPYGERVVRGLGVAGLSLAGVALHLPPPEKAAEKASDE